MLNTFSAHMLNTPLTLPLSHPLNHIFDTYQNLQNLLQLHSTDIQKITLSIIHGNDFLKKLVLLETPTNITTS